MCLSKDIKVLSDKDSYILTKIQLVLKYHVLIINIVNINNKLHVLAWPRLLCISDIEFDKFQDKVDTEKLYMQMKSILKCSKCNRLWVFWDGLQNKPKEYVEIPVKES